MALCFFLRNWIIPQPTPTYIHPLDLILELDLDDEVIIRDLLSVVKDSETKEIYDLRTLSFEDEHQIMRMKHVTILDEIFYNSRSDIQHYFLISSLFTKNIHSCTKNLESRRMKSAKI
jgi:hypothetical protein